jgi:hypothetical protein
MENDEDLSKGGRQTGGQVGRQAGERRFLFARALQSECERMRANAATAPDDEYRVRLLEIV